MVCYQSKRRVPKKVLSQCKWTLLQKERKKFRSIVQKAGGRQRSESKMVPLVISPVYCDILILSQTQKTGMCMLILGSERRCVFLDQELGGPVSPFRHRLTMT